MNCCVVIPVYKSNPSENELRSIRQCQSVLARRDIMYVAPYDLDLGVYPLMWEARYDDSYFQSVESYSELLESKAFYELFTYYDYILIHQPDCWVFCDNLDEFMGLGYDYIGAPWFGIYNTLTKERIPDGLVGNGGLSLRKVETFLKLAENDSVHPEDIYWSIIRGKELNIAPTEVAARFSLEHHPEMAGGIVPMGCHKPWQLPYYYSFWRNLNVPEFKK